MNTRTALVTAGTIVAVVVGGATATAASLGILSSASTDTVGNLPATTQPGVIAEDVSGQPSVLDMLLPEVETVYVDELVPVAGDDSGASTAGPGSPAGASATAPSGGSGSVSTEGSSARASDPASPPASGDSSGSHDDDYDDSHDDDSHDDDSYDDDHDDNYDDDDEHEGRDDDD